MTTYRCLVDHATGQFVAYAGCSFRLASEYMRAHEQAATTRLQRLDDDGWRTIVGVYRAPVASERPDARLLQLAASYATRTLTRRATHAPAE